jgi:hypothetical protein
MELSNIKFKIEEGGILFTFNDNETAFLQLPDTGDSQHQINGLDESEWTDKETDIFKQLSDFYFASFSKAGCAAASAELGKIVHDIVEIVHKNTVLYVAFDEDDQADILVDSDYKDYYNKLYLFARLERYEAYNLFDGEFSEDDIIEKARQQREASI